ncbi:MAG TPA: hypothetical protein V6D09_26795 [Leptolyngbyaceae cyanobacterium]
MINRSVERMYGWWILASAPNAQVLLYLHQNNWFLLYMLDITIQQK